MVDLLVWQLISGFGLVDRRFVCVSFSLTARMKPSMVLENSNHPNCSPIISCCSAAVSAARR